MALARWTVSDIFELALDECNLLQRRGENTALNLNFNRLNRPWMDAR